MKKIITLLLALGLIVTLFVYSAHGQTKDFTQDYIDHASFYGFGEFFDEPVTDESMHGFTSEDYKFWGIPESTK